MKRLSVIICSLLLLTTGCGLEKPEVALKKAGAKLGDAKSITMNMTIDMAGKQDNQDMNVVVKADMKMDIENKITNMNMNMDMGGMAIKVEGYVKEENNKATTYTKSVFGSDWTKKTEDVEKDQFQISQVKDIFENGNTIKKVESEEKETRKYEVKLTKEQVKKLMSSADVTGSNETNTFVPKGDVTALVYVNADKYISKIVLDLTNSIEVEGSSTSSMTKFVITLEFSDLNKTTVSIPEDVIKNAKEEENYDDEDILDEESAKEVITNYSLAMEDAYDAYKAENGKAPVTLTDYEDYEDFTDYYVECEEISVIEVNGKKQTTLKGCSIDFEDTLYDYSNGTVTKR